MEEDYKMFMNVLDQIVYKIRNDEINNLEEFVEAKRLEIENYHKSKSNKEIKYIDKLVRELK